MLLYHSFAFRSTEKRPCYKFVDWVAELCYEPNWVEQDVSLLIQSTMEASREAVSQSGINPKEIASISFSTQRTCSLFLDSDGVLVRPMISWQDNRTSEEVKIVEEKLGRRRFHEITCLPLGAIWILNKMMWLRKNEPENWARVRKVVQLQDYFLNAHGADDYYIDRSDAGLFGCWDLYQG